MFNKYSMDKRVFMACNFLKHHVERKPQAPNGVTRAKSPGYQTQIKIRSNCSFKPSQKHKRNHLAWDSVVKHR